MDPKLLNRVHAGDCLQLTTLLPRCSIDIVVTSPPYWGQRISGGLGVEDDPRGYLDGLIERFEALRRVMKPQGLLWINMGDAYNTPVNWRTGDRRWSTLGQDGQGLAPTNSAYVKPRHKRRAFLKSDVPWLRYGNLLALPYRLVTALCESGFLFRGEVIWRKRNPLPEGRCRRPHRAHESIYLLALREDHHFKVAPPVKSVWEFANEQPVGFEHYSRFPLGLPRQCIAAYGRVGADVVVLDPFSGSGTTCLAAIMLGCSYIGFEIDQELVRKSNEVLEQTKRGKVPQRLPNEQPELVDCPLFASRALASGLPT